MRCDCGKEMQLQGVGAYFKKDKEPVGARHYFCSNCKEWTTVSDEYVHEVKVEEKN